MRFNKKAFSRKQLSTLLIYSLILTSLWNVPSVTGKNYSDQVQIYEILYELDYISGYEPNQTVIEYVQEYYRSRGILLRFEIDEITYDELNKIGLSRSMITNGIDYDEYELISEHFFSQNGVDPKYKWILYGGYIEDGSQLGASYARTIIGRTIECRHIFIALKMCKQAAEALDLRSYQVEAVVLMHEMGHSIGILKESSKGTEIYDSDTSSVMALVQRKNCEQYIDGKPNWHYSKEYWNYRYMSLYQRHLLKSNTRYWDQRALKIVTSR